MDKQESWSRLLTLTHTTFSETTSSSTSWKRHKSVLSAELYPSCLHVMYVWAYGSGGYAVSHPPTTTCTVGYRNVSDMCGFLIVWCLYVNWLGVVSSLAASLTTELFQGAAAELFHTFPHYKVAIYIKYYKWLSYTQAKVTICLQGTLAVHWLETSCFSNICSWFFSPPPFASGCICRIQTIIPYSSLFPEALRRSALVRQI